MIKHRSCILAAGMLTALVHGQDKPARLTFEVASIKPAMPGGRGGGIKALPGGQEYTAQNVPVKLIISLMYKVPIRQITVKLKFHKETKEGPVYALMVDKPGSKMKVNESAQDFKIPIGGGRDGVVGTRVPMQYFAWWLGQILQRDEWPVIDKTGLDKNYDFTLSFAPEFPPNFPKENIPPELLDRPTIFDALKQQLGLKLEAQKGPVEYYVIDHVEKPAEN